MRLALLVPRLVIGGAERAIVFLANELARGEHQIDLVVVDADGPLRPQVAANVTIIELGGRGMVASAPRLVRYLRERRPVALLSTLTYANVVTVYAARWAGTGVRVLVREATTLSSNRLTGFKGLIIRQLLRGAYNSAHRVVAVSSGVAEDLATRFGIARERLQVIYNPSIPADLAALMRAPVEHPWFGDDATPLILAVGRFTTAKDYPNLIEAFARIRAERPARLVILGDGELRPALESLVAERNLADHVSLPGFVDNPFAYMARASAFVLSSRYEGMPNVLIQAMASGCPVVSTDCKSGPSEVLERGRYGPLVPIEDPAALADAIGKVLDGQRPAADPSERAGAFSVERIGAEYLAALTAP